MTVVLSEHQPRADLQRPEELPHRHIEGEWRLLDDAVAHIERVGRLHPQEPVGDPAMRADDTLRSAR